MPLSRLLTLICLLLGSAALASALKDDRAHAGDQDRSLQVARIVSGIIGFSRWPGQPATLRFCVAGETAHLKALFPDSNALPGIELQQRTLLPTEDGRVAGECDILYIAQRAASRRTRLLNDAIGRPVLTISEGDALCAEACMFCLALRDENVALLANLDAISRSGIRINPKVLQLVQRKQGTP